MAVGAGTKNGAVSAHWLVGRSGDGELCPARIQKIVDKGDKVMSQDTLTYHAAGTSTQLWHTDGSFYGRIARNLLDVSDGFLVGKTHLIMDRDPLFARDVRALLNNAGVEPVRLPARSPNLNAYAERFVLSIKSECLDKLIILGERHLRLAVREYVAHYNRERPHQGLAGDFVVPPANENQSGPIETRERLGGLLRFYHRRAA